MRLRKTVIFCCVVVCWNMAALADKEEASEEEVLDDQNLKKDNETSSIEMGPPDSHEAMNYRDGGAKIREKRSYEFLMGLINNNSRFEVTRVDPSPVTQMPKVPNETKMAASELLLELMVRIASHPQQWEKVHQLLQKLDKDLTTSRSIVHKLQSNPSLSNYEIKEDIFVNKKKLVHSEEDTSSGTEYQEPKYDFDRRKNYTKSHDPVYKELKWPTFDNEEKESPVKFVNNTKQSSERTSEIQKYQVQNKSAKITYPKNFSYHRVTGKPIYLNKTPKAYVAVSVISPKSPSEDTKDDEVTLENELHQLKPWWGRSDTEKSAATSKWVIRTDEKNRSVVPTL